MKASRIATLAIPLLTWAAVLATTHEARALPANQLCIKFLTVAPTMNGDPSEAAWTGATSVTPQDAQGAPMTWGKFKFGSTEDSLYIGGKFEYDQPRAADSLVLGLSIQPAAGGSPSGWKFVIRPFFGGNEENESGAGAVFDTRGLFSNGARQALWWQGGAPGWNGASGTVVENTDDWLRDTGHFAFARQSDNQWSFEMRIPRVGAGAGTAETGVPFGSRGDTVKLYINMLTTIAVGNITDNSYQQYPWPQATTITNAGADVATLMPAEANWGSVTLNATGDCGISLTSSNIGVLRPPSSSTISNVMSTGQGNPPPAACSSWAPVTNRLVARPHSTLPVPITDLQATFEVSQFGISNNWTNVGPPGPATIQPGSDVDIKFDWSLTGQQACTLFQAHDHQCFRVGLSSATGNVLNAQVQRNMHWGPASEFKDEAVVDTKGLTSTQAGDLRILLQSFVKVLSGRDEEQLLGMGIRPPACSTTDPQGSSPRCECLRKWEQSGKPGEAPQCPEDTSSGGKSYQTMLRVVKAFLKTGSGISINGTNYEEARYLGSYTYLIRHFVEGDPEALDIGWSGELQAAGLKRLTQEPKQSIIVRKSAGDAAVAEPELYLLNIAPGAATNIATKVVAKEGPKGSFDGPQIGEDPCKKNGGAGCCRCAASSQFEPRFGSILGAVLGALVLAGRHWQRRRRR